MNDHFNPKRIIFISIILITSGWAGKLLLQKKTVNKELEDTSFQTKARTSKKVDRKIASHGKAVSQKSSYQGQNIIRPKVGTNTTERINEASDPIEANNDEEQNSVATSDPSSEIRTAHSPINAPVPSSSDYQPSSAPARTGPTTGQTLAQATLSQGGSVTFGNVGSSTPPVTGNVSKPPHSTNNSGNNLSCSASIPNGSYSYALSVTLACSTSATIKYCLSEGSCCDPNSNQGRTYSSSAPIIIGENNTQYCLSYYAVGKSSKTDVSQKVYKISKQIPDLYVETPITWMQTTEAPINSNIISLNFGKNDYSLAQISYLSHNIGPSGDHLNCEEVATEMASYTSPSPLHTLSLLSLAGLSTSQQVEVPLSPSSLEYGTNYVATYIVNTGKAIPTYACSISEFTLMDFPFFDSSAITDSGEFTGGFTPFGFYEENFDFPRSPAGQSSSGDTDQKIETAFLSVIY